VFLLLTDIGNVEWCKINGMSLNAEQFGKITFSRNLVRYTYKMNDTPSWIIGKIKDLIIFLSFDLSFDGRIETIRAKATRNLDFI